MTLAPEIRIRLEAALAQCTDGAGITGASSVGGGCISRTLRLTLANGARVFAKIAEGHDPALLAAEARGLELLRATGTVRVPTVLALHGDVLLLEWLEPGGGGRHAWAELVRDLAALHRCRGAWGGVPDNFIGALPQSNSGTESWPSFWATRRLEPQVRRAGSQLDAQDRRRIASLSAHLEELLAAGDAEGASLLHGDLWNGNVHLLAEGGAALVDPASCYGHREVDLAMAELFGGFAPEFRSAYEAAWPLAPDWPRRQAVYQLYYLLVHVNLFGSGYLPRTRETLRLAGF